MTPRTETRVVTLTDFRRQQAQRFASQLGLEGESLFEAAMAVWSNLNPQTTSFDTALSAAGVALRAAATATSPGPAQPDHPAHPGGAPGAPGPQVTVVAPDGTQHCFTVTGDHNMTVLVDGEPVLGVDRHGPGRWIGEQWQRLHPADRLTKRSVAIEGITTKAQWHDLETALGLNPGELGYVRPWDAGRAEFSGRLLKGRYYDLDAAVAWARLHGLAYEDRQCVRTDALLLREETNSGARGAAPEPDRPAAPGLAAGQDFTGAPGTPLPGSRGRRPAVGTTPSANKQTQPGTRQ